MREDKLFDFAIGNPPYQLPSDNTSDKSVYNVFMDGAYKIADKAELITPARFLSNAGNTPTEWNERMLNDTHFKILQYEEDSKKFFPSAEIKGGILISYYDNSQQFEPIKVFTKFPKLNDILHKVIRNSSFEPISNKVFSPESYKFTDVLYEDHPEISSMTWIVKGEVMPLMSRGHEKDLTTNIFDKLSDIVFFDEKPSEESIMIAGRKDNKRKLMWIERKYIKQHQNLDCYKVLLPKSNGGGIFGEILSDAISVGPGTGHTQTFISIGAFETEQEVKNLLTYIKTKFLRAMLGVMKVTQDNKQGCWKYVPLQNFTSDSNIDWSKPVKDIDQQLYRNYKLSNDEITFIETQVKEMN